MLKAFAGVKPRVAENAFVEESAQVVGDVTVGEYSSIWCNAVARGDVNKIVIGRYTNIQDNCTLHVADEHPCIVGDYVTVGHGVILHGCTVREHCLIGMGAVILNGAEIGAGSIVGAGAVVGEGKKIPPRSLVVGVPGKVIRELTEEDINQIHASAIKYKHLWTVRYGFLPDAGGEQYTGEKIV